MATLIKVTFKRVNGDNTAVYARPKAGDLTKNRGVLYMRNCPDGKTFYVNPDDEGNIPASNWYLIEKPTLYKLPDEKLYCRLLTSYCSWEEITVDDESEESTGDETIDESENGEEEEKDDHEYKEMMANKYDSNEYGSYVNNEVWYAGNKVYTSNSLNMGDVFSDSYDMYKLSRIRN